MGQETENELTDNLVPGYSITRSEKTGEDQIMCLTCGRVSHNPNDVAQKYCGYCHVYHEILPPLLPPKNEKAL